MHVPEAERQEALAQFGLSINLPKMKTDLERYKIHYDYWVYESSLHESGYVKETVDLLAEREHTEIKRMKFKSLCGDAVIAGKRCLLMKPTTYMNNSGQAVAEAMQFYKLPIDHIIVVYDDISLEPSRLRIRRKGSDGGHNGIKSII